jgi:hypothetical protein
MLTLEADWERTLPVVVIAVDGHRVLFHVRVIWAPLEPACDLSTSPWQVRAMHQLEAITPWELRTRLANLVLSCPLIVCHRACPLLDVFGLLSVNAPAVFIWDAERVLCKGKTTTLRNLILEFAPHVPCQASSILSRAKAIQSLYTITNTAHRLPCVVRPNAGCYLV